MVITGHDIQIGAYHSAKDFHLIPAKKCVVQPPAEKVISLNVPGMNGQADLSHAVTGYPVFYEREGSWIFYSDLDYNRIWSAYQDIKQKLALQCHDNVKVILDDEPTFYYKGKVWMGSEPTSSGKKTKFTLQYRFYPFKYLVKPLEDDWLWDDFNFETDLAPQKIGDIDPACCRPQRPADTASIDRQASNLSAEKLDGHSGTVHAAPQWRRRRGVGTGGNSQNTRTNGTAAETGCIYQRRYGKHLLLDAGKRAWK